MDQQMYRFLTEGLPCEGSEEVRRQRTFDAIKTSMKVQLDSGGEEIMKQVIENPRLLLTQDVRNFRDHIQKNGHSFVRSDLPKCSDRAEKHRSEGNVLFAKNEYIHALKKYNESICSAPSDSEDLGIGYANRSAIFYNKGEYILALKNIKLAKEHNYPNRLMSKLAQREVKCRQAIDKLNTKSDPVAAGTSYSTFLSDKICVRKFPMYNNGLVAIQNIKAGDVLLQEKPMMVAVHESLIFVRCYHCLSENLLHLLPCPNCVSAMFCNEICMQSAQAIHRYECGIVGQLSKLHEACIASRMFFRGLDLFDNNIDKMMSFCRTIKPTENTFLDVDYSSYDPVKEFEIFLSVNPRETEGFWIGSSIRLGAAIINDLLLKVSAVRALLINKEHEDFMLQCFVEYFRKAIFMSIHRSRSFGTLNALHPLASLCNHSCRPNTLAADYGGQLKLIALRPIRRDEQIFISYGANCDEIQDPSKENNDLIAMTFQCICDICDVQKHKKLIQKAKLSVGITEKDWTTVDNLMTDPRFNQADRKNALQQFIQRYNPNHELDKIVTIYSMLLTNEYVFEINAAIRAKNTV